MILIDTSAWVAFFRNQNPVADLVDRALDYNDAALCGPVYTELLRGLKNERERYRIIDYLDGCAFLVQPKDLWMAAGDCGYRLQRKGRTVKSMDLLIACYAIALLTQVGSLLPGLALCGAKVLRRL